MALCLDFFFLTGLAFYTEAIEFFAVAALSSFWRVLPVGTPTRVGGFLAYMRGMADGLVSEVVVTPAPALANLQTGNDCS